MKIAYFELGFTSYPEDYSISPKGYGGGPAFARWAKELLNDKENEFWLFAPEECLANLGEKERRDRCVVIKPASLQALRSKQPITEHISGIERFDIICHHHTGEWINKGYLTVPVVHWSGFGTGEAGHPKNDYTLLYSPEAKSVFGEKMKRVKIGKPVPKEFLETTKEDFIFQCTRHDDHMGSCEVARQCLAAGIKGYFAGPISNGCDLMNLIDNETTFYLGVLDEQTKMDWTKRAILTTYLHNWDAPFNLSVIESLSVGTPILANNRGFFKHILKNSVNGFAFNGQNFKASFNAAKKLHQKDCWKTAREYSVEEMVGSFKKAFEEILEETKTAPLQGSETRFGIAANNLGDLLWVTPLARHVKNLVIEIPDEPKSRLTAPIFDGLCRVEFKRVPIPTKKSDSKTHIANQILEGHGIFGQNCIPKIKFKRSEIDRATQLIAKFKKPIVFCNQNSGCADPKNHHARYVRPDPNLVSILSLYLQALGHTVIQFEPSDDLYGKPFPIARLHGAVQIKGLSVRDLAACYAVIGKYVGGDTGDHHLMLAVGGRCFTLVPEHSDTMGYDYSALLYQQHLFVGEPARDFYFCHKQWAERLDHALRLAKNLSEA